MSISINNTMTILLIVTASVVLAGLIVIPVIEETQALKSSTALEREKGARGESASGGKRNGQGGGIDI